MQVAIWGHLATDVKREGSPENIVRRCRDSGIDLYFAHVYPMEASSPFGEARGTAYKSRLFQNTGEDLLTPLLREARRAGVEVEPWLLPFDPNRHVGETPEDLAARRYHSDDPDAMSKKGRVLCASWPENRARAVLRLQDYLQGHGDDLTGIHMDAIRYVDTGLSLEHPCRCAACKAKYLELFGTDTITAKDLAAPGARHKFLQFRGRNIRSLVEEIRDITNRAGLKLSMAARADYLNWALVEGQDWVQWAKNGLVDSLYAMSYFVDRETHRRHAATHARLLKGIGNFIHGDGLGKKSSFGGLTTEELIAFGNDALEAGAAALAIFHYNGMGNEDFKAIRQWRP